jgi:hypothetical protein
MTKKYGISKNEQKYRKNFRAFCSAAMELKKDDLRAVNTIFEEAISFLLKCRPERCCSIQSCPSGVYRCSTRPVAQAKVGSVSRLV